VVHIVARVVPMEDPAPRPVSLEHRRAPMTRHRQVVFARTVRFTFPPINVAIATPDIDHPAIALINVSTKCSHIGPILPHDLSLDQVKATSILRTRLTVSIHLNALRTATVSMKQYNLPEPSGLNGTGPCRAPPSRQRPCHTIK
jgi:hypothetical protein